MTFSQERIEQLAAATVFITKIEATQNPLEHKDMRDIAGACGENVLDDHESSSVPFANETDFSRQRVEAGHTFTYFKGNVTNQERFRNAVLTRNNETNNFETLLIT